MAAKSPLYTAVTAPWQRRVMTRSAYDGKEQDDQLHVLEADSGCLGRYKARTAPSARRHPCGQTPTRERLRGTKSLQPGGSQARLPEHDAGPHDPNESITGRCRAG